MSLITQEWRDTLHLPPRVHIRAGEPCPETLRASHPEAWRALAEPRGLHYYLEDPVLVGEQQCWWCGKLRSEVQPGFTVATPWGSTTWYHSWEEAIQAANALYCARAQRTMDHMDRHTWATWRSAQVLRRIGVLD